MYIQELKIQNFKNHKHTRWEFGEGNNLIAGRNGTGKTNLLDAIHMICLGKSYFSGREQQILQWNADFYRLEAKVIIGDALVKIVLKYDGKSKKIEKDDIALKSIAEHVGHFPCTVVAPEDIELVNGFSELRRKFIDQTLCQTDVMYLKNLMQYNQLLKQRNALLKQHNPNPTLLDSYDMRLIPPAVYIHQARKFFFSEISKDLSELHKRLSGGQDDVVFEYSSQLNYESLEAQLKRYRQKDLILQRTNVGIHKDDLSMEVQSVPLKNCGSQGQVKTVVFALKMAQYQYLRIKTGQKPLLILDDVFDKLDPYRISFLFEILEDKESFGQVFITDTNAQRILDLKHFNERMSNKTINISEVSGLI